jgi:predicted nucleic acid-binding Zn ribbon protein
MDVLAGTSRVKGKKCRACGGRMPVGNAVMHVECQFVSDFRRCLKCVALKPLDDFSNDRRRADGKYPWCKTCQNLYMRGRKFQGHDKPPNGNVCPVCDTPVRGTATRKYCSSHCREKVRRLARNFRLTIVEYRALIDAAGGRCPICDLPTEQWHVDHDHGTGLVTGVVCPSCNTGALARTFHSTEFIKRLLAYLEETPASRLGITATADESQFSDSQLHAMWARPRG